MNATEYCICGHEEQAHIRGECQHMTDTIARGLRLCPCMEYEPEPEHKRMARLGPAIAPRLLHD